MTTENKIDYSRRLAFLHALCLAPLKPLPLDRLIDEVLPVFERWRSIQAERKELHEQISAALNGAVCSISEIDHSEAAQNLRQALDDWMTRYRFTDSWIRDAAISTLYVHQAGAGDGPRWYLLPHYEALSPTLGIPLSRQDFFATRESKKAFLKEFDKQFLERRKAYIMQMGIVTGERAPKDQQQVARWIVQRWAGWTFPRIATHENLDPGDVRKAVVAFARRAGLTLPTLGETLGSRTGKRGKIRDLAGTVSSR